MSVNYLNFLGLVWEACRAGISLGGFGSGVGRGYVRRGAQGVNPAVSRRAGLSSSRNERKRLGEPVLIFLRDNRTCPRGAWTVFCLQ